jgi:hypothetical protein
MALAVRSKIETLGRQGRRYDWSDLFRGMIGHFSCPFIRVPGLLDQAESNDQSFRVFALNVIAAIIKDVYDSIILKPQHRPGIKCKPLLQGNLHASLHQNFLGLLNSHIANPSGRIGFSCGAVNVANLSGSGKYGTKRY